MRIRTATQFVSELDAELAWRLQEIAAVRQSIRGAPGTAAENASLRAAIPLLYAHWEGFVKQSAIMYADLITSQGLTYSQIKPCFRGLEAHSYIKSLDQIVRRLFATSEIVERLDQISSDTAVLPLESYIGQVGNLNYDMFDQIARFLGVDTSTYLAKKNLIDVTLLKRRNTIAHGSYIPVDRIGYEDLGGEITVLMRQFKDDLQNAAVLKTYLAA